jgi:hypothetical protein
MSQFNGPRRAAQRAALRWDVPPPHATRRLRGEIITVTAEVYTIAVDGTLRRNTQTCGSVGPDFERLEFQGAGHRLAAAEKPQAGLVREPARPKTTGDTPRSPNSSSTIFLAG